MTPHTYCWQLLQQAFGTSILQPLEEQDKNFVIHVKKMNLTGFVGMIKRADVKDHLENFSLKYDGRFIEFCASISTNLCQRTAMTRLLQLLPICPLRTSVRSRRSRLKTTFHRSTKT